MQIKWDYKKKTFLTKPYLIQWYIPLYKVWPISFRNDFVRKLKLIQINYTITIPGRFLNDSVLFSIFSL
jgi:hypothetical protein